MPSKKPPAPTLQTILDRIDGQGALIEDVRRESLTALAATRVALEERMDAQRVALEERIDAQGVRLEERIDAQGVRLEERMDAQGVRLEGRMDALDLRIHGQTIHFEDVRSLNRLTIEAVEAARLALEERIDALDRETRSRDAALELAIRDLKVSVQQNTNDIRDLAGRVEALTHLEQRVSALERRLA